MGKKKQKESIGEKATDALSKSPINYFSDLFIAAMVVGWIIVLIVMVIMAIYSTVVIQDTTVWAYVWELTGIPLTAGGAIWMVKNSVQHAIANNQGKRAPMDFPAVDADEAINGLEEMMEIPSSDDSSKESEEDAEESEEETETDEVEFG